MSVRVVAVMPEPTPYRTPLFDRIASRPEVDLTVVYSAHSIAGNAWRIDPEHPHMFLRGARVPGAARLLRHDYPVTPDIVPALERLGPQCLVITGWSTFASQAATVWARARRVPYILIVESHDRGRRSGWRRIVKAAVVPPILRAAGGILVTGTVARDSVVARGADASRVRVFANTVDVEELAGRVSLLRDSRAELRRSLVLENPAVLSVARLAPEKGLDVLLRAAANLEDVTVVLVGEGPEREALERLAGELHVDVRFLGTRPHDQLAEVYAAADVFALLSRHEPWGVVVNEAAAAGLPLILSDEVGAAADLLQDRRNGRLVRSGDVDAATEALRWAILHPESGAVSRDLVVGWGYGPSEKSFIDLVLSTVAP